jgi:hypothetical protein
VIENAIGVLHNPPLREGYMPPSPQQQQYSQINEEKPYYILKTNYPFLFWVPDGYDPDHFMPSCVILSAEHDADVSVVTLFRKQ